MVFLAGSIYHKRKNWVAIKEYVSIRHKCLQQYMASNKIGWVKIVGTMQYINKCVTEVDNFFFLEKQREN